MMMMMKMKRWEEEEEEQWDEVEKLTLALYMQAYNI